MKRSILLDFGLHVSIPKIQPDLVEGSNSLSYACAGAP